MRRRSVNPRPYAVFAHVRWRSRAMASRAKWEYRPTPLPRRPELKPGSGIERIEEAENGSPLLEAAFELRREVFVAEQGVPAELEIDELDPGATHLVAIIGQEVVGTLRILAH